MYDFFQKQTMTIYWKKCTKLFQLYISDIGNHHSTRQSSIVNGPHELADILKK